MPQITCHGVESGSYDQLASSLEQKVLHHEQLRQGIKLSNQKNKQREEDKKEDSLLAVFGREAVQDQIDNPIGIIWMRNIANIITIGDNTPPIALGPDYTKSSN